MSGSGDSFSNPVLNSVIPSYAYQQYCDSDDILAFITAYNTLSQKALNFFNIYPTLADYTNVNITGFFLDWIGNGIYGIPRPVFSSGFIKPVGPYNTYAYNTLTYNTYKKTGTVTFQTASDEIYRRVITWNFFKGDGNIFNILWLKRRVAQFLGGAGGVPINVANTEQISVQFLGSNEILISIGSGLYPLTYLPELISGIQLGILQLPFQYTFRVG